MAIERRREPRVATDLQGTLGTDREFQCQVADLSRNGALAISTRPMEEHSLVHIRLELQGRDGEPEDFACDAAVVRCEERTDGRYDIGLYFLGLSTATKTVLERVISTHGLAPKI